ncbi:MAG: ATP-dependent sacrificial sulfur transferase LarE [Fibrobacteraceae bacterium]|nr:ATP-dependent sacrificial sulfur transferase LarE [Fibrobacteraceae bacterium]
MCLQNLKTEIENFLWPLAREGVLLGFSGGTDSALLAAILAELSHKLELTLSPILAIANSPLQNPTEIRAAQNLAQQLQIPYKVFELDTLSIEAVKNNHKERCYHCKKSIFETFAAYAKKNGLAHMIDGTNIDDTKVYRPGRRALAELGVVSPFVELGISKQQIRNLSKEMNLCTWQKPATPCLATRFPYNVVLTQPLISMVAEAENWMHSFLPNVLNLRVRCLFKNGIHGKIEVDFHNVPLMNQKLQIIQQEFQRLGFNSVSVDQEGFSSGKMDRT